MLSAIVAVSENFVIGRQNDLNIREEINRLKHRRRYKNWGKDE